MVRDTHGEVGTGTGTPPTVLLVDDNKAGRYVLSRTLRFEGFRVWEAGDAAEGLRLAAAQPDIIVLDVKLPDLNGFEVCRRLKLDSTTAAIPVIHMSASYWQEHDRQLGLASGAVAYITGFDVHTVVKTVREVLGRGDGSTVTAPHELRPGGVPGQQEEGE